jgi:hypothetical protein
LPAARPRRPGGRPVRLQQASASPARCLSLEPSHPHKTPTRAGQTHRPARLDLNSRHHRWSRQTLSSSDDNPREPPQPSRRSPALVRPPSARARPLHVDRRAVPRGALKVGQHGSSRAVMSYRWHGAVSERASRPIEKEARERLSTPLEGNGRQVSPLPPTPPPSASLPSVVEAWAQPFDQARPARQEVRAGGPDLPVARRRRHSPASGVDRGLGSGRLTVVAGMCSASGHSTGPLVGRPPPAAGEPITTSCPRSSTRDSRC